MTYSLSHLREMGDEELIELCITQIFGGHKEEYERTEHCCCEACGKCNESCEPRKEWRWRIKEGHPAYDGNTKGAWWYPIKNWEDAIQIRDVIARDKNMSKAFMLALRDVMCISPRGEKTPQKFPFIDIPLFIQPKDIVLAALLSSQKHE